MNTDALTLLAVVGVACVIVAAFCADWRAGLALVGLVTVMVAVLLERARPDVPPDSP